MKEFIKLVFVGHVDHGKSSLIGRLLMDTNSLKDGVIDKVKSICVSKGKCFEPAFLLDALEEEQDQGITIDITKIEFETKKRHYTIIDAPGHKEFLKNMISGAANADVAILMIDAKEGVREQTKRHAYILSLLGITQVCVVINKMDLVNYSELVFNQIVSDANKYLTKLGVSPQAYIPVSAKLGDNVINKSEKLNWFLGKTILESLDEFKVIQSEQNKQLRFPIQDTYKFDDRRIVAGRIESGRLNVDDEIMICPSNHITKITSIESWNSDLKKSASAGESIGITLADEFFFKRGNVITKRNEKPLVSNFFKANIFWMGRDNLVTGKNYLLKLNTQEINCEIVLVNRVINSDTLDTIEGKTHLSVNDVGVVIIKTREPIVFDKFSDLAKTGRFVLVDNSEVSGGGIIEKSIDKWNASNVVWSEGQISKEARATNLGHSSKVLWFTGLSGSGKSTIARALEQELHKKGINSYVLDGDNIRHGLNKDLGFSKYDRIENIRRISEVAKLFHDAGIYVIVSFISPHEECRKKARELIGKDFIEVFVDCPVEVCEKRDTKGLYAKARKGEIKDFTGISAPYEKPECAEIVLNTNKLSVKECIKTMTLFERGF